MYNRNIGVFSSLSISNVNNPMQPEYLSYPYASAVYRATTHDFNGVDFYGFIFLISPYIAMTA